MHGIHTLDSRLLESNELVGGRRSDRKEIGTDDFYGFLWDRFLQKYLQSTDKIHMEIHFNGIC